LSELPPIVGRALVNSKRPIVPDGEQLVEAVGESIEIGGVGVSSSVGAGACKGDGT